MKLRCEKTFIISVSYDLNNFTNWYDGNILIIVDCCKS